MAGYGSLQEVARKAGVSPATVSRVVNGRRGVGEATRQRVQSVIDQLGYAPDRRLGQFFRTMHGGSQTVVFVLAEKVYGEMATAEAFYSRMHLAVQAELSRRERHMLLVNAATDRTPDGSLNCLAQGICDGVIGEIKDRRMVERLAQQAPMVLMNVDFALPHVDVVIPNVERAAQQQIAFLAGLGHRKVACFRPCNVADSAPTWQDKRYWSAYRDTCSEYSLQLPPEYLQPILCDVHEDEAAIAQFLQRLFARPEIAPTAILTYDFYAGTLLRQLNDRGLRVPQDVSIVGYDDYSFNSHCPLALTTFRQDFEAMAKHAVRLFLERLDEPDRPAARVEIEGQFIERDSTAAPARPVDDSRVLKPVSQ
ncbi:MAG: LacI family transcriptional regulator [Candidatus Pacebacteria bacterium]|nr:LacI family transcriptional regulator [Candidatus Paceibacterota bacterium]